MQNAKSMIGMCVVVMLFLLLLPQMPVSAATDALVLYNQHISSKILWTDTNFNTTDQSNSGCIVEIVGNAGDIIDTRCSIPTQDAAVSSCGLSSFGADKIDAERLNADPYDFKVRWTLKSKVEVPVKIACIVLAGREKNTENPPVVGTIRWEVNNTQLASDNVPISEDINFYQVHLPIVSRAWSGQ